MEQQSIKMVINRCAVVCAVMFMILAGIAGCGSGEEKTVEKKDTDLIPGNWVYYKNRTYVLIVIDMKGTWKSSVRIADVTSKIVDSRGMASGIWNLDAGQLILTVGESDIEDVWKKDSTIFYKVLELNEHLMVLEGESGRKEEWKKATPQPGKGAIDPVNPIVAMAPYAVNLDKHSSNVQDRYLCLSMHLQLLELMPDQPVPQLHPRARDAAIMYLSSLTYDDVSDFDRIKVQAEKVKDILNPYMEGLIKEVVIDHVVVALSAAKVEEFIIEHTAKPAQKETPADGKEGEAGKDQTGKEANKETPGAA
ncbi:flagellar basal body-associated FliL family protein [uncultured Desulfobacter sp.]|uniref:flagellar basal body-associated FliL family protein n=1 Tax=uncultured Desulfobacter sp. TaxID=240139 RepID=UPI002AAB2803|nr:flagellar basal body-associated FliL family protein [uncultured Desulfobacter sp.]